MKGDKGYVVQYYNVEKDEWMGRIAPDTIQSYDACLKSINDSEEWDEGQMRIVKFEIVFEKE